MDQLSEEFEEERVAPGVGGRIRAARESAGLSLAQVSAETRITQRHLEMIEAGDFDSLPARTYAVGFSRSVAKAVGLDPAEIATEVRAALNANGVEPPRRISTFEPGDPARVPSAKLGWVMALLAIVLLVIAFIFLRGFFSPAENLPPLTNEATKKTVSAPAAPHAAPAAPQGGAVVFTALAPDVWVKFYDASGKQLMQKEMAKGESYTVPADAQGPLIWTGRPDALAITVGGQTVPPLADRQKIVKGVPVTAQALLARQTAGNAPAASPVRAVPTPSAPAKAVVAAPAIPAAPVAAAPAAAQPLAAPPAAQPAQ